MFHLQSTKNTAVYVKHFLLLVTCILILTAKSNAQHPNFYKIDNDKGLPSNEVYQLLQDDFGYMWIGCNYGLFRYDGFKFKSYTNKSQNGVAISGLRQVNGKIWCQNFNGQIYSVKGDSLNIAADVKDEIRSYPQYTVSPKNDLIIALPKKIIAVNETHKQYTITSVESAINEVEYANESKLLIQNIGFGIEVLDKINNENYKTTKLNVSLFPYLKQKSSFEPWNRSMLVITEVNPEAEYYISEIDKKNEIRLLTKIPKNFSAQFIYTLNVLGNGEIWLGTSNGAYPLEKDFTLNESRGLFKGEKISDIILDKEGNYWFSSLQNGIFVVPNIKLLTLNKNNSNLLDNNITGLKKSLDGNLFIGDFSGNLYSFNTSNFTTKKLDSKKENVYRNANAIIETSNSIICSRGLLSVTNKKTGEDITIPNSNIRSMDLMGDSIIFVASFNVGLIKNITSSITKKKFEIETINTVSGRKVVCDPDNKEAWIALNMGLFKYSNNKTIEFKHNNKSLYISALHYFNKTVWCGNISNGLIGIKNNKIEIQFNERNGLRGKTVKAITGYKNKLYVSTEGCINIIDLATNKISYISSVDGLNVNEINCLEIASNYLFVGTNNGLYFFPISINSFNNVKPDIKIVSATLNDSIFNYGKNINLNYNENIQINFESVALKSIGQFKFKYRLKNLDDNWNTNSAVDNFVRYSSLPAGDYVFEVMALNEDKIASDKIASINISVNAPFWQRWWFYLLCGIGIAGIVAGIFLFRIKSINRKALAKNKLYISQLTALKAQMNPHFMFNALNSIQDLVLQHDIKNSNLYLSKFGNLTRKILNASDSEMISLEEEIDILSLYLDLEKLRFGNDFTYTINSGNIKNKDEVKLPSMILQPFVENAIKHGLLHKKGNKNLEINFELDKYLICEVIDNGVGRTKSSEIKQRESNKHNSFATAATEKRFELINEFQKEKIELQIIDLQENGEAKGTKVILKIPQ